MALTSGTRLGPYEIAAPLGAGGMGEVYRARDTRLDRDVAIKVAADRFSERFDREARAIAALNHSNICRLYDVGPNYLVMEYLEGAPLKGPLPLQKPSNAPRRFSMRWMPRTAKALFIVTSSPPTFLSPSRESNFSTSA